MCNYMYFNNAMTESLTELDRQLLLYVCTILKIQIFIRSEKKKEIKGNLHHTTECHTVSRMLCLILKDLTLVDGYITGFQFSDDRRTATVVHTNHSWLTTPNGAILDPYPMGVSPQNSAMLIPTKGIYTVHGANYYFPEKKKVRKPFDVKGSWKRARFQANLFKKYHKEFDIQKIMIDLF